MPSKYTVVNRVTADAQSAEAPTNLADKTFPTFRKAAAAICEAITVGESCTVRRMDDGQLIGHRQVLPTGNGGFNYVPGWNLEY